jgi:hypothetical protein
MRVDRAPLLAALASVAVAAFLACSGDGFAPLATDDSAHVDTATVGGPMPKPPVTPPVASFTLNGTVVGHEPGLDTMKVVAVPGAGVTLVRVADVDGDTLKPSVVVTTTTTDTQGHFRLENLPAAYYRVDVRAPEDSPFADGGWGVSLPTKSEVSIVIALQRR